MSPNIKILTDEWFKKGNNDLKSAQILFAENGPTDSLCFHTHQIAEKYLKGFLLANKVDITAKKYKIHELPVLRKACLKFNPVFNEINEECLLLNKYYIDTRYPVNYPIDYTHTEAKVAIEAAEKIVKVITELI